MIIALAALAALATPVAAPIAQPNKDWRAIAIADVSGAYHLFAENHPGMANPDDPGFPARLAAARDASLKIARETRDWAGYDRALDTFTDGLSDGHAFVVASDEPGKIASKPAWPGFIAAWRGSGLVIHHAGPTSPAPRGSQIISCDGKSITQLMRENIRGLWFRPAEAGQWWSAGSMLMFGSSPPDPAQLRRCTFHLPDGRVREAQLPWGSMPSGMHELYRKALAGESTPVGLSEPRRGLWLVGLSTFSPDEAGAAAYRKLYIDIDQRRAELLRAKAIVLDLRFNNGGSWEYGHEVARRLWGKRAAQERLNHYFRNVRIWWRASPDNIAAMPERVAMVRAMGHDEAANEVQAIADGMKAALAAGRPYFVEPRLGRGLRAAKHSPTDLKTPVYVITDGGCASACLDAVDMFKRFGNVKLIGAPTSADTIYMEVRRGQLPSGYGRIVIPLKIWMNRPRKSGEIYRPDIPFNELDWSTTAFLDRIEADLQRRVLR